MTPAFASSTVRSLAAAVAGFLVYGGWAYFVNQEHGFAMGARAGLTQGSYSFALTLSTTYLMEFLLQQFSQTSFAALLTITITIAITFFVAYAIHLMVGTPEILLTIMPGFLIGAVYTISYVTALRQLEPDA